MFFTSLKIFLDNDVYWCYYKQKGGVILKERIKKLRKALDLTQQKFAEKIGTSANVLTNYETGRRNPSSSVINNICKTFNVNEKWLRTGNGEIFKPVPKYGIDMLAQEYNLTYNENILIEKFVNLKPENRQAVIDYILEVANSINNYDTEIAESICPENSLDIEKEVDEYRKELELEKKVEEKSSVLRDIN